MRLLSWNLNGIRAVHNKGLLLPFLDAEQPDVLALQETKALAENLPEELLAPKGYELRLHPARKKGYSGVAIYTRQAPDEWFEGMGDAEYDDEGRVLGARFGELVVLSAYFPNAQAEGARLPYRLGFGAALIGFMQGLQAKGYHVALGGDYNVAHQPIDLARPKQNEKNPGYLPEERAWMTDFLTTGYVDTYRDAHPERTEAYSWWSYRANARAKNIGWRLDYWCVDADLAPRVEATEILPEVMGSDHCPVGLRL